MYVDAECSCSPVWGTWHAWGESWPLRNIENKPLLCFKEGTTTGFYGNNIMYSYKLILFLLSLSLIRIWKLSNIFPRKHDSVGFSGNSFCVILHATVLIDIYDNIVYAYNEKWINVTNQYSPLCTIRENEYLFQCLYVLLSGSNDKNNLTSQ